MMEVRVGWEGERGGGEGRERGEGERGGGEGGGDVYPKGIAVF